MAKIIIKIFSIKRSKKQQHYLSYCRVLFESEKEGQSDDVCQFSSSNVCRVKKKKQRKRKILPILLSSRDVLGVVASIR